MRILFCNYEYPPLGGGGGVVNALLAEELAGRHDVTVLTSQAMGLPRVSEVSGVRVVRVPVLGRQQEAAASMVSMLSYVLGAPGMGRRSFADERIDVINTHFVLPTGPVGDRLSRALGVPNVLSVHGGDLYDPSKFLSPHRHLLLRAWVRRLVRRADAVVGQSKNTMANLRRFYAPEIEGIRIPLGIRRPPEGVAARADYGLGESDTLLITVGRIVARKAVDQLVTMVSQICDPTLRLLIMGTGPLQAGLQQQCRELGIEDRVVFLGKVEETEKFRILRMCDAFVSTSQHEGFGLVFLEAMACGLPVMCYGNGGQTDFLVDGVTGPLVKLNDREAFTERCRSLAADPATCKKMGQENLRRVEEFFIDGCARLYEEVFESVIAGR